MVAFLAQSCQLGTMRPNISQKEANRGLGLRLLHKEVGINDKWGFP